MYFLVTTEYETDRVSRSGKIVKNKVKQLFEAESVEEVTIIAANYHKDDAMASEITSIVKLNVDSLVSKLTHSNLYK